MTVFLCPKHVRHLRRPARHLRGHPDYEKNGHGYDIALKKRATVPNSLFLRILRAGSHAQPFHCLFFCVRSTSDIFAVPLGIYEATRTTKKTVTAMTSHSKSELRYRTAHFYASYGLGPRANPFNDHFFVSEECPKSSPSR